MTDKVIMPKELTAENGAKGLMLGEFWVTYDYVDSDSMEHSVCISIDWSTIKGIYNMAVEKFGEPVDDKKYNNLYNTVNEMMCTLGAKGQITTRANEVHDVMDALHDIDGGEFKRDFVLNGGEDE